MMMGLMHSMRNKKSTTRYFIAAVVSIQSVLRKITLLWVHVRCIITCLDWAYSSLVVMTMLCHNVFSLTISKVLCVSLRIHR